MRDVSKSKLCPWTSGAKCGFSELPCRAQPPVEPTASWIQKDSSSEGA